eukprot:m.137907 g.137907  ORF g.137907 m.137907 type:complete len:87 (+) comp20251_c0_seq1:84-344(+)
MSCTDELQRDVLCRCAMSLLLKLQLQVMCGCRICFSLCLDCWAPCRAYVCREPTKKMKNQKKSRYENNEQSSSQLAFRCTRRGGRR